MADLIDRQAAVNAIRLYECDDYKINMGLIIAMNLIEKVPSVQTNTQNMLQHVGSVGCVGDCISRQGMCDSLNKYRIEKMLEGNDVSLVWDCIDKVLQEPSAQHDVSERKVGEWQMFDLITSTYYGKGMYFKQDNGTVYSRYSCEYMSMDKAISEFLALMEKEM